MTQTNNEREIINKLALECGLILKTTNLDLCPSYLTKLEAFAKAYAISHNEQQDVVAWVVKIPESRRGCSNDIVFYYKMSEMLKEHILAGDDVTPLYASPPKQIPDGWKLVKIEPSDEHLRSMAIRSDHGLGIDGYYDTKPVQFGASHAQRMESTIREMRQLYEEAIGEGFYKLPEAPTTSLASETNTEVGE